MSLDVYCVWGILERIRTGVGLGCLRMSQCLSNSRNLQPDKFHSSMSNVMGLSFVFTTRYRGIHHPCYLLIYRKQQVTQDTTRFFIGSQDFRPPVP